MTKYGEDIAVLKGEMKDVKSALSRIESKLDNLDDRYPTRREFAAVKWVLGIATTVLGLAVTLMKFGD